MQVGAGEVRERVLMGDCKVTAEDPSSPLHCCKSILCLTSSGNLGVINRLNRNFVMDEWYKHVCLIHLKGALAESFLQTLPNYRVFFFFTS